MSKKTDSYSALATALGLSYDSVTDVLYGQREGYELVMYAPDSQIPYMLCMHVAARNPMGTILTKDDFKELSKGTKALNVGRQEGNNIIVNLWNQPKQEKLIASAQEGVNALMEFLKNKGYEPCCSTCGQRAEVAAYRSGSSYFHLCETCASNMLKNADKLTKEKAQKQENVIGGIIGAFIGTLLGVLSIVLFFMAGRVAALSGFVMAICALKGYELLAGKLSKLGMAISAALILIMTYLGARLGMAIVLFKEHKKYFDGLMDAFLKAPELSLRRAYLGNMALVYLFVLVGAVSILWTKLKEGKMEGQFVKIGGAGSFGAHIR